ncbi:SH3 domain-containing protein [Streptomyces smaragdinus]|uniref:SH3 domain-containing protein n=1 Tax=Streptomyces smaragdinus TaxID=2585196 RepID=UPI002B217831|nr:SH3 domain-containing protein [Streptomyces smaragdinus]
MLKSRKVLVAASAGAMVLGALAAAPTAAASQPGSMKTWWDDSAAQGVVIARGGVNIRSAPTTNAGWRGIIGRGVVVDIECKTWGPFVLGNDVWFKLSGVEDGWVSARWVKNVDFVPSCDHDW